MFYLLLFEVKYLKYAGKVIMCSKVVPQCSPDASQLVTTLANILITHEWLVSPATLELSAPSAFCNFHSTNFQASAFSLHSADTAVSVTEWCYWSYDHLAFPMHCPWLTAYIKAALLHIGPMELACLLNAHSVSPLQVQQHSCCCLCIHIVYTASAALIKLT